jgi:hypothetical protein
MQYVRQMARSMVLGMALLAMAGCERKAETPTKTVAPTPTPTTTVAPTATGDLAAAARDAAVAPTGAEAGKPPGEAGKPSGEAGKPSGTRGKPIGAPPPGPSGIMLHGSPEEGTLQYNPPPQPNPAPKRPSKK